jgi:hypothetical protein
MPMASAEKRSEMPGMVRNDARMEQMETNCIFFLILGMRLNYVRIKNIGITQ